MEGMEFSSDDESTRSMEDDFVDFLTIDLTSPLGRKLNPIIATIPFPVSLQPTLDYEKYCNRQFTGSEVRELRSSSDYGEALIRIF